MEVDNTEQPGIVDLEGVTGYAEEMAASYGWVLNPDLKIRDAVIEGLARNWEEHGAPYCPCQLAKSDVTICPCDTAEKAVEREGKCHCLLFYNPDHL